MKTPRKRRHKEKRLKIRDTSSCRTHTPRDNSSHNRKPNVTRPLSPFRFLPTDKTAEIRRIFQPPHNIQRHPCSAEYSACRCQTKNISHGISPALFQISFNKYKRFHFQPSIVSADIFTKASSNEFSPVCAFRLSTVPSNIFTPSLSMPTRSHKASASSR